MYYTRVLIIITWRTVDRHTNSNTDRNTTLSSSRLSLHSNLRKKVKYRLYITRLFLMGKDKWDSIFFSVYIPVDKRKLSTVDALQDFS